mgnify:CR=1 FL=1
MSSTLKTYLKKKHAMMWYTLRVFLKQNFKLIKSLAVTVLSHNTGERYKGN